MVFGKFFKILENTYKMYSLLLLFKILNRFDKNSTFRAKKTNLEKFMMYPLM